MVRVFLSILPAILLASACTSSQSNQDVSAPDDTGHPGIGAVNTEKPREASRGLDDAVLSPLTDLNLRRETIPVEIENYKSPYDASDPRTCDDIEEEVTTLDSVLGSDIDLILYYKAQGSENEQALSDRASGFAVGQIASEASGLIPFRGIVRSVTGANSHQQSVDAAYQTAFLRRSYLKGLGSGMGCSYPAAPLSVSFEPELPDPVSSEDE